MKKKKPENLNSFATHIDDTGDQLGEEPEDKVFSESKEFRQFVDDFDMNVKSGKIKLTRVG